MATWSIPRNRPASFPTKRSWWKISGEGREIKLAFSKKPSGIIGDAVKAGLPYRFSAVFYKYSVCYPIPPKGAPPGS